MSSANRISKSERDDLLKQAALRRDAAMSTLETNFPDWERKVEERARKLAIGHLGIEKELVELDKLRRQALAAQKKVQEAELAIRNKLPKKEGDSRYHDDDDLDACGVRMGVCEALNVYTEKFMGKARQDFEAGAYADRIEAKYLNDRQAILRADTRADLPKDCL
jgi:hypothetical protein